MAWDKKMNMRFADDVALHFIHNMIISTNYEYVKPKSNHNKRNYEISSYMLLNITYYFYCTPIKLNKLNKRNKNHRVCIFNKSI